MNSCAGAVALAISSATSREDRFLYAQLARQLQGRMVLLPAEAGEDDPQAQALAAAVKDGTVRAVIANGNLLPQGATIPFSLIIDCLHSPASHCASVVLPAAVLSESGGTFRTAAGAVKQLAISSRAPGDALPEWRIVCDLARALGLTGFDFENVETVTPLIMDDPAPAPVSGDPRQNARDLTPRFRGHLLADVVPALAAFGLPTTPAETIEETAGAGFPIIEKREIAPNMHFFKVKAEQVAKFSLPGQFVILMARETSERSPFTLVDWDAAEGTISLVIEEVGRSSRELASLKAGDRIAHVSGPLGHAPDHRKQGHSAARRRLLRHRRRLPPGTGPASGRQPGDLRH